MRPLRVAVFAVLLLPGLARAHPALDAARDRFEGGDLLGALEVCEEAERRTDLSRRDLERMFELRSLIYRILGDEAAVEAELTRLASIAPEHRFSDEVPPELRETFARARARLTGPIEVEIHGEPAAAGVTLGATVDNDPAGLVRRIRLFGRRDGALWQERDDALVLAAEGAPVEAYAEAVGPGGAVLARHGSREEPIEIDAGGAVSDGRRSPWPWVGLGAGLAAATVAVVLIVVLGGGGNATQPGFPREVP
jgi:hypothetical protein